MDLITIGTKLWQIGEIAGLGLIIMCILALTINIGIDIYTLFT